MHSFSLWICIYQHKHFKSFSKIKLILQESNGGNKVTYVLFHKNSSLKCNYKMGTLKKYIWCKNGIQQLCIKLTYKVFLVLVAVNLFTKSHHICTKSFFYSLCPPCPEMKRNELSTVSHTIFHPSNLVYPVIIDHFALQYVASGAENSQL